MAESARIEPSPAELDNLARFLTARGLHRGGTILLTRFSGGQSNPTYLLQASENKYVLRRKPYGSLLPSAHAIDREYRVQRALLSSPVPVARPIAYCTDTGVIGAEFYLAEHVEGIVFWDHLLPGLGPEPRARVYEGLIKALSCIHGVDFPESDLSTFGASGNYVERQVRRWTAQYRASEAPRCDAMEALIEWLPKHIPPAPATTLVHGDYRLDNVIFDSKTLMPRAVLDWEVSTLGDPFADFAYFLLNWHLPPQAFQALGGVALADSGIPDELAVVSMYCKARGLQHIPHLSFYIAFNLFKLAAILEGIAARARAGTAASQEAAERGRRASAIAEMGWILARTIKLQGAAC